MKSNAKKIKINSHHTRLAKIVYRKCPTHLECVSVLTLKKQQLTEHIIKEYENNAKQIYLAKKYGISQSTISKIIQKYYLENELKVHKKKEIPVENKEKSQNEPKKLRSATVIVEYLKKGLTIQEILETASKKNVIISQEIINTALNKVNNKKINDNNEER